MYFNKIRHPSNFRFANAHAGGQLSMANAPGHVQVHLRDLGEDVFHVEFQDAQRWPLDARLVRMLDGAFDGPSQHRLEFGADGTLALTASGGQESAAPHLAGLPGASFGMCGGAWLMQFARDEQMRFYGQGHKMTGLEKTGRRTKFWNTDVFADHAWATITEGQADPQYVAIPYLLVRVAGGWVGLLVDHPGAVFMDTGSNWFFGGHDDQHAPPSFWFGADQGVPAFYVIAGASAPSVTRRLQRLVGTTPLPPLWALGHHQCRWGYKGPRDLLRLDEAFRSHGIPCDGLWLDIDYMDRYKVFTTSAAQFEDRERELAELEARGRKVVAILDPGVKVEAGDAVAEDGRAAGIYCLNPEGEPFVGFVWPGRTWMPDFSLPEGRAWWAGYVKRFREWGFHGAWIDMNDPAVGAAELDDMRFQRGQWAHWTYHNIYATGMAEATQQGFAAARPDERPFVLSRSASAGASRYTAVWTGDNVSNWHHLRASIPGTLNLALSGIPFNGPDVPGFAGHADAELAIAWYKAGFLFPFLRNHNNGTGETPQEPWALGAQALEVIRHFVRLRYKLLPYLYQLWVAQAHDGSAVMRPLFHDFANVEGLVLDHIDDQFMVGPALMQAPLVRQGEQRRTLALPGPRRWFDAAAGRFIDAGRSIQVTSRADATPLFVQEGHIVPMQPGERSNAAANDLAEVELHVMLGAGCSETAHLHYVADDGASHAWQRGERSECRVQARRDGATLHVQVEDVRSGWRPLRLRIVGYDGADAAVVHTPAGLFTQALVPGRWRFCGEVLAAAAGEFFLP